MGPSWGQELFRTPGPEIAVARPRRFEGFWGQLWGPKLVHFLLFLGSCFGQVFGHFLEHFWANFGEPFWDQMGLRRAKMGSKRPIKSFKVAKTCICKNLKKQYVFHGFWASKAVQDSLGRPKKAPKRHLKSSKGFKKVDPKMEPILTTYWTTFGALLGPILEPKSAPEGDQKWDHFWNP